MINVTPDVEHESACMSTQRHSIERASDCLLFYRHSIGAYCKTIKPTGNAFSLIRKIYMSANLTDSKTRSV